MTRLGSTVRGRARAGGRCAFTLIELVAVVLILGVVAGLVTPRLASLGARRERQEASEVARVLASFSRREALSPDSIAVEYAAPNARDATSGTVRVVVLTRDERGRASWREDALTAPARLNDLRLIRAEGEGVDLSPERWRVEGGGALGGATISIELGVDTPDGLIPAWRVTLDGPSGAVRLVRADDVGGDLSDARVLDLDLMGMGESEW